MKKFVETVKVKLNDNVERYFRDVEVESIKHINETNCLNFNLVSYNLISRDIIIDAENDVASQLFDININSLLKNDQSFINPVRFNFKYVLDDKYTCKAIYDEVRKDLFNELKDKKVIYGAFFRNDNIKFIDDETMEISFVKSDIFEQDENDLIEILSKIFLNRYNRSLKINVKFIENIDLNGNIGFNKKFNRILKSENLNDEYNKNLRANDNSLDANKKTDSANEENNSKKTLAAKINKSKKKHINANGSCIYGEKTRFKFRFLTILNIDSDSDNVETKGIIYNVKSNNTKNGRKLFSVYIYDGEACIEIKFFGEIDEEKDFNRLFRIGKEIRVCGSVKYDSVYSKAMVFGPIGISYIEEVGEREVIEFGKVTDEDYHNIFITDRTDDEIDKRVELHLHTKSSMQDGVGEIKAYIDTATKFGMSAMAITDHGCVNALADGYEYLINNKRPRYNQNFKLIYGVEGYLVDDYNDYYVDKDFKSSNRSYDIDDTFVIYELVFTGKNKKNDELIKIEAVKIKKDNSREYFNEFIYTKKPLSIAIRDNTGVKESDIKDAEEIKIVLNRFRNFIADSVLVTSSFDKNFLLSDILKSYGFDNSIDTLSIVQISRMMLKNLKRSDLVAIAKELKIKIDGITNRKKDEAKLPLYSHDKIILLDNIFITIREILIRDYKISNLSELKDVLAISDEYIMRQPYYHIILLAKNDVGRVNLYKLVSDSNVKYTYNKRPRMPRSLINKYREGIIVGSACILGEFMDAIKNGASDERLKEIASYYDYLEIQPTLNNSFLLQKDKENFKTLTDLENLNKKVVEIGEELDKLVVATCDCHYVEKNDKLYRTILRYGTMYKKTNYDASGKLKTEISDSAESSDREELYFRTTREMLDEFSYLGVEKAREVVVTNTNLISNMIENIDPLRKDKCPPHIEGSDDELINTCIDNFKKIFADNDVPEIKSRLDNELKYIIDNGYSVMYIAAKKLIDYSRENGYPVGSRGSVGSSLAATMLGITEVNPLKPYYICPRCHKIIYDTEETNKYLNDTGFDMPDKMCPTCNTKMIKDGVNIPFETFLGIPGDAKAQKEPDIDLNFCSVFQSSVHKKTVEMFGEKNTFKAGTVGTVAEKTAFGYVKKYAEMEKKSLSNEQTNYFAKKILDCKNNTGQHPGGMVVVPEGEEIYSFTPIQLATSSSNISDITTHYDYHKIDSNLLKLDLLGHEAPLMLKKLAEVTGVDYMTVPFYEKEVLSLFENPNALGIKPEDISGTKLGCLTLPEFGTDFAMRMCEEAKPKTVADLIRIAGLAHGTDVWQGNVQTLIKNGDCTLSTAICCRDDIMIYLIEKGMDKGLAFNIMEKVRKGKGLEPDWIEEMKKHDVPDWYIGCCKKIKYMFPKAHAAAYVLASLRIAYYKVHYPKEYYATYFSIKKDGIDYKYIMQSKEDITYHIAKIKKIINEKSNDTKFKKQIDNNEKEYAGINYTNNEEIENEDTADAKDNIDNEKALASKYSSMSAKNLFDLYMVYRVIEEMQARGIEFCPLDIYKAKRSDFIVYDGRIMPSFDSIPGIGTKDTDIDYNDNKPLSEKSTAMKCEIEGRKGEYSSIENFRDRTKVNSTIVEVMKNLGLLDGLKESDQNTVFDYM